MNTSSLLPVFKMLQSERRRFPLPHNKQARVSRPSKGTLEHQSQQLRLSDLMLFALPVDVPTGDVSVTAVQQQHQQQMSDTPAVVTEPVEETPIQPFEAPIALDSTATENGSPIERAVVARGDVDMPSDRGDHANDGTRHLSVQESRVQGLLAGCLGGLGGKTGQSRGRESSDEDLPDGPLFCRGSVLCAWRVQWRREGLLGETQE